VVTTAVNAKHRMAEAIQKSREKHELQPIKCPSGAFFCDGHLDFLPLDKQSRDKRYCRECLAVIEASTGDNGPGDYWVPNKGIFISGGRGYVLTPDLRTVCRGKEEEVMAGTRRKTTPTATTAPAKSVPTPQDRVNHRPRTPRTFGTPLNNLPADKIKAFRTQGLGARAIVKKLKAEGIKASRMTVYRAIQKESGQMELPLGG